MAAKNICIALDAMGGDFGPSIIVPAALETLEHYSHLTLILVGKREAIEEQFTLLKTQGKMSEAWVRASKRLQIQEATQVVTMGEPPALALRHKRDSSMRVAINLVKEGKASACVSAGNTGALMAIARFVLKTLPGIDRPAIVYSLPTLTGHTHVLDLGANVDCSAEDLFQFAMMGAVLVNAVDNHPHPKVGLLNVGSEAIKGSEPVKRAAQLLSSLSPPPDYLNYIGFVEGDDIYKGTADVVVCDGFVGNVALKTTEGLLHMLLAVLKQEFNRNWLSRLSLLFAYPVLNKLRKRYDPKHHNGASLLGLKGIVIKSHGKADQKAFARAIRVAVMEVEKNVPERIQKQLEVHLNGAKNSVNNINENISPPADSKGSEIL